MLFNSIEFLIFLPVVFGLYWRLSGRLKWQNLLVVAASYLFYGWWNWRFLVLIAFTTLCSYLSGLAIERFEGRKRWVCGANILVNLAILGVYKYYDFFAENFRLLLASMGIEADVVTLRLVLPVGISFYTFQALSYTIDVYRGRMKAAHDTVAFFAFITFFPQLVAGPIERATALYPQFLRRRKFSYDEAVSGCKMILWGIFKKIVIADGAAMTVNTVFGNVGGYNATSLWIAAILFSFQIYGDFSGYSDIARGVARLFGIRLMRNFNLPYLSRSIPEFWRRWHISLNTWFVDYVYIPLGGSRCGRVLTLRNVLVVFLVSGLWHGANWTFIVWGLYHALFFIPQTLLKGHVAVRGQVLVTFLLVTVGWVIFRSADIGQAVEYISRMMNPAEFGLPDLPRKTLFYVVECVAAIMLLMAVERKNREREFPFDINLRSRPLRWAGYVAVTVWTLMFYVVGQTFIYFQF